MKKTMSMPKTLKFGFVSVWGNDPRTGKDILVPRERDTAFASLLAHALNLDNYEMVLATDGEFGSMMDNGSFTGAVGLVQRDEVDMVVTDLSITEQRKTAANFSFPYFIDDFTFTTKKPQLSPKFLTVVHPFSLEVWVALLTCLMFACLAFYMVLRKRYGFEKVVLKTFGSLVSQSPVFEPGRPIESLMVLSWSLGTMFLAYSYTAVLLSFLTLPLWERGIRTIPELSEAISKGTYRAATYKGIFIPELLSNDKEKSLQIIGEDTKKHLVGVGETKEFLLTSDGKVALITPRGYVEFLEKPCLISRDKFFNILVAIPYSKSFCCPDQLDIAIQRILASGLYKKITNDFVFKMFLEKLSPEERNEDEQELVLNLVDMGGAFLFLLIGLLLSSCGFLLEIIVSKIHSMKQK